MVISCPFRIRRVAFTTILEELFLFTTGKTAALLIHEWFLKKNYNGESNVRKMCFPQLRVLGTSLAEHNLWCLERIVAGV